MQGEWATERQVKVKRTGTAEARIKSAFGSQCHTLFTPMPETDP